MAGSFGGTRSAGRLRRLIRASAHNLHSQPETSNIFLENMVYLKGDELEFPHQPRPGAAVHRARPGHAAARPRGQPGHHRTQRPRHRHRPGRSRLRAEAERRPPQPLSDPGPPAAARTHQPGARHRRGAGAAGRRRRGAAQRPRSAEPAGRRFVIAVDAGSNQVSVLRIRPGGSLRLVRHGVVSSGGLLPDSVAVSGDLVYLANSGAGGSNYTGFRLRPNGRLDPIPAQGLGPFGSEFRSADPGQLFVSNAHNTATDSDTVSAFTDSADGTLSPVAGSPFADGQMAPCWVEITHDGQFLFTVNTASGTISRFSIAPDCVLTLLSSSPTALPAGATPAGIVVN